jgi:hypothetical protein
MHRQAVLIDIATEKRKKYIAATNWPEIFNAKGQKLLKKNGYIAKYWHWRIGSDGT